MGEKGESRAQYRKRHYGVRFRLFFSRFFSRYEHVTCARALDAALIVTNRNFEQMRRE